MTSVPGSEQHAQVGGSGLQTLSDTNTSDEPLAVSTAPWCSPDMQTQQDIEPMFGPRVQAYCARQWNAVWPDKTLVSLIMSV